MLCIAVGLLATASILYSGTAVADWWNQSWWARRWILFIGFLAVGILARLLLPPTRKGDPRQTSRDVTRKT
jgi:hypothetical protein